MTDEEWQGSVSPTRAREIRQYTQRVLLELPVDIPPVDALDAVWGVIGEMSPDEEAVSMQVIAGVLGCDVDDIR